MSGAEQVETIDQVVELARAALEPGVHTWAAAGAGQGATVARNAIALASLALVPRVGRDVSAIDTSTSFLGIRYDQPVALAPVGALAVYDPGDAQSAAEAATTAGIPAICSLFTASRWEDITATAPGRHLLQLYAQGDRSWLEDLIERAEGLGFGGICMTLDSPVIGRRDRSLTSGYVWRGSAGSTVNFDDERTDPRHRSSFTWADLEWVCERSALPVVAKGIMCVDDARAAVSAGVRGVYVSNHGGRMVDHALSTIEVLREVVDEVASGVDVAVDSGFASGADVCKALAMGAKIVGIGRLQCWALAAGGAPMLTRTLEILRDEVERTMANIGCRNLAELGPESVRWSVPVPPPSIR